MADESPDMRPESEPGAPDSGESIGTESVDELLDRASSLATEMAVEIGEASPDQRATQSEESITDLNDLTESLDKQLDQMDKLTKEVGNQVGKDQPEEDDAAPPPMGEAEQALRDAATALDQSLSDEIDSHADPQQDSPGHNETDDGADVPDFMSDLTEPDELPKLDVAGEASSAAAAGFDDDLTAPPGEQASPAATPVTEKKQASESPTERATPTGKGKLSPVMTLLSALTRVPMSALCILLDLADRPFGWVPPKVRALIGVAALATLATSAVVLVISML